MKRFLGVVDEDGEVVWHNPRERSAYLASMVNKNIEEAIYEKGEVNTPKQKAYFFATNRWLIDNVESFGGWEEEDVKAFAVSLFATKNVVRCDNNGEEVVVKVAESIRNMSKKRMSKFIDRWIIYLSQEQGVVVPSYDELIDLSESE
jgi:hypothetical protein